MSQKIPPVAVLVAHRVADFDKWKIAFDNHTGARKEAGVLGHHLNQGADDPNMVYVYCPGSDVAKLQALMADPKMAEVMKDAGVVGPPTVWFMTPKSADFIPDEKLPGIIVAHAVEDYDKWRAAYDEFDEFRKKSGIVGHAVNQELGKPNRVIIYHQARDKGALRALMDSSELKETMQRAGVSGPPDIHFVQAVDFQSYE